MHCLGFSGGASGNLPVLETRETRVRSLGQKDPLEKEMATHSSILAWRIPWTRSLAGYSTWGHKELDTSEANLAHTHMYCLGIPKGSFYSSGGKQAIEPLMSKMYVRIDGKKCREKTRLNGEAAVHLL